MSARPLDLATRRSLAAKSLGADTAWAVLIGPEDRRNLYGLRATKAEAEKVARHVTRTGALSQVVPATDLLTRP